MFGQNENFFLAIGDLIGRLLLAADGLSNSLRMTFAQALTEMDEKPISTENGFHFSSLSSIFILNFHFRINKKLVEDKQKDLKSVNQRSRLELHKR